MYEGKMIRDLLATADRASRGSNVVSLDPRWQAGYAKGRDVAQAEAALPSSADLDAVAAEDKARAATTGHITSMADALEPCPDCGSRHHKSCPAKPAYRYVALIVRVPEPTGIVVTTFSTRIGNLVATALHCYEAPSVRGCEVIRSIEITEQKAKEIW